MECGNNCIFRRQISKFIIYVPRFTLQKPSSRMNVPCKRKIACVVGGIVGERGKLMSGQRGGEL